jgi:RNA 3'-terminal phosphate cyclase (ATP)
MSQQMIEIDGSRGEGGGQILRTSLALSVITGKAVRLFNIRAKRPKPGLRRQHLTCVLAAAQISGARVDGAEVDSRAIVFRPGDAQAGEYVFDIASAGSTMLVLQTVLPPLMLARGTSKITLKGGTHNTGAPPFDFLAKTFLPLLRRMGASVDLQLERAGFVPRGGGVAQVTITPGRLKPIALIERGAIRRKLVRATIAGLPRDIAQREIDTAARALELRAEQTLIDERPPHEGPGNVVTVEVESDHLTELFTAFGERGVRAEEVARAAAREARRYLDADAPIGEHLADQLLLPMALAGGGTYITGPLTLHTTTNIETIGRFLDVPIASREIARRRFEVVIGR